MSASVTHAPTVTVHAGCIVFKDKAVFHRSFPSAPPELALSDCVRRKPRLSPAHFSALPHVQVFNKAGRSVGRIRGLLVGGWVEGRWWQWQQQQQRKALIPALLGAGLGSH